MGRLCCLDGLFAGFALLGCLVADLIVCYFVVLIMLDSVVFELLWVAGWCGGFWRLAGFADLSWGWYNIAECRGEVRDGFWWFWCLGGGCWGGFGVWVVLLGGPPVGWVLLCIAFRWVVLGLVVGVRKLRFWLDWCWVCGCLGLVLWVGLA